MLHPDPLLTDSNMTPIWPSLLQLNESHNPEYHGHDKYGRFLRILSKASDLSPLATPDSDGGLIPQGHGGALQRGAVGTWVGGADTLSTGPKCEAGGAIQTSSGSTSRSAARTR